MNECGMWFDVLIKLVAYFWVAIAILITFWAPFSIGEPREDYAASNYVITVAQLITVVLLAGRIIGWW